jgi:predicted regulator of Ras-like GTPase activity (Roadblock/LC7/MglB family)
VITGDGFTDGLSWRDLIAALERQPWRVPRVVVRLDGVVVKSYAASLMDTRIVAAVHAVAMGYSAR